MPSGTNLPDGAYTLTAWAIDNANNRVSAASNITIDTRIPVVSITSPRSGTTVASLSSLSGSVTDERSGIARVALYLRRASDSFYWTGSAWTASSATFNAALGSGTWSSTSVPTSINLPNGEYALTAYAFDRAGNRGRADSRFFVNRAGSQAEASPVQLSNAHATNDGRIVLTFTGALADVSAENFVVTVNSDALEIIRLEQTKASEIVLTCAGLAAGTRLAVHYNLQDTQGRAVVGEASVLVK